MATPEKEATQPTEAGFSTNLFLNSQISGRVQFTFRGARADDWQSVMSTVHTFLTYMHEKGWMLDGEWRSSESAKAFPVPSESKVVPAAELPPDLPTAAEGGASEYSKDEFDSFQIIPEPDDKATVKFFKAGLKYPVGAPINKWKNKNVVEMLRPLGEFDPAKPQTVAIHGVQYWVNGNEYTNQKGEKKHYKDLKAVEKS